MKKVFLACSPEEKASSYAAIVRRGGMPVDPAPIFDTLPADLDVSVKDSILRESISGADEVWVVGDNQPADDLATLINDSGKPVKNVLFEFGTVQNAAPAAPASKPAFSVCLLYKEPADAEMNFVMNFDTEEEAVKYMYSLLETLSAGVEGRTFKVAADKKSGYVAFEKKLVCTAYLVPVA